MKFIKLSIVFLVVITIMSCNKKMVVDYENLTVERYVELLKADTYEKATLPTFSYEQIPALLEYRNSTETIADFPRNPISSYQGADCTLGMYVLWTVESIRAVSIESEFLTMGFPSLNPIVHLQNSTEPLNTDETSHLIAAQAYYDWWYDHEGDNYETFKAIEPLVETDYQWWGQ